MFRFLLRSLWRAVILLIGIGLVWGTVQIYPYADSRMPAFVVLLLIYIFFAYIGIPVLFRLLRIFIKSNHIPLYAATGDGWPADPVNIAVVAKNEKEFIKAMKRAGWYKADPQTLKTSLREVYAIVFNRAYPHAPFTNLYLFGRAFDIGFQKPANGRLSPRSRHHVRFWRLEPPTEEKNLLHFDFWNEHLKHLLGLKKQVWIGAAIDDSGPIWLHWRYGQLTHRNDLDTNKERDLIVSDLHTAHQSHRVKTIQAGKPFSFRGQALGKSKILCDGTIKVLELRSPLVAKITAPVKTNEE